MRDLKPLVAALAIGLPAGLATGLAPGPFAGGPAEAQEAEPDPLADLFTALRDAEPPEARQIIDKIGQEWSRSGSPAMDLLLQRGREALEAGDNARALEHFGALVDHAPDFAEGYNARATAYFNDGRFGPALADIQTVLSLNPRHFGALTGFAIMLEEIERPEAALDIWRRVQEIYPASPQAERAIPRLDRQVQGRTL